MFENDGEGEEWNGEVNTEEDMLMSSPPSPDCESREEMWDVLMKSLKAGGVCGIEADEGLHGLDGLAENKQYLI